MRDDVREHVPGRVRVPGQVRIPGRVRVPVGADAARWVTRGRVKRVLFVVHNVTSATRLLDVKPLFDGDLRVQMAATCTGSSPFLAGVPELLAGVELPVLPWEQAKDEARDFDVVIAASYGGELEAFEGKLVILSHGVGYNKRLAAPGAGSREPGAGSREPGAGSREPGAGSREPGAGSRCHSPSPLPRPPRPSSASAPSGCSTTDAPSRRRPSSPTPSSSAASAPPARRRPPRPSSPVTPATTASSKRSPTATASAAPSASPPVSGSSSSTPPGRRARCSVTARRTGCPGCCPG